MASAHARQALTARTKTPAAGIEGSRAPPPAAPRAPRSATTSRAPAQRPTFQLGSPARPTRDHAQPRTPRERASRERERRRAARDGRRARGRGRAAQHNTQTPASTRPRRPRRPTLRRRARPQLPRPRARTRVVASGRCACSFTAAARGWGAGGARLLGERSGELCCAYMRPAARLARAAARGVGVLRPCGTRVACATRVISVSARAGGGGAPKAGRKSGYSYAESKCARAAAQGALRAGSRTLAPRSAMLGRR